LWGSDPRRWRALAAVAAAQLLLGGRIGQRLGYRRTLLLGLTGFALASLLGGLAGSGGLLIGARTAQGVFGALMTPAPSGSSAPSWAAARPSA
jgi:MFS family permease